MQTAKTKTDANNQKKGNKQISIKMIISKNEELENQLKRTLADYQNLERRIEDERRQLSKLSAIILIEKLLPIVDNLENAQGHLNDEGLAIVIGQFKELLKSEGVEEIEAEGSQFDPNFHEAVETQQGENDNRIVKVVIKGYKIEDRVLRAAKVIIERKEEAQKSDNQQENEDETKEVFNL